MAEQLGEVLKAIDSERIVSCLPGQSKSNPNSKDEAVHYDTVRGTIIPDVDIF